MASFTFTPTADVPEEVLTAASTHAKVRIEPIDAYIDATVEKLSGSTSWTAIVGNVPQSSHIPRHEHRAILCLYKGELGKYLGSISLGQI